jgi:2'-5' RNA ligase
MAQQFSLAGFDPPEPPQKAQPTDRLFFALVPDATAAWQIAKLGEELRRAHGLKGRVTGAERLHTTLLHLGDYAGFPDDLARRACETARALPPLAPFDVSFDRVMSFRRPRDLPLVLRGSDEVAALFALQRTLEAAARQAQLITKKESFTPHVTLLYDDTGVAERPIAERVGWHAHEFVLVHSLLGQSKHVVLERFGLKG